jgi:hypothetical protein
MLTNYGNASERCPTRSYGRSGRQLSIWSLRKRNPGQPPPERKSSVGTPLDCVSPISGGCTGGTAGAFRLQRDERVGGRTRWFLSVPSSSLALARIQQSRPLLSDNDLYIKVKRMGWFISRMGQPSKLDGIIAQHRWHGVNIL